MLRLADQATGGTTFSGAGLSLPVLVTPVTSTVAWAAHARSQPRPCRKVGQKWKRDVSAAAKEFSSANRSFIADRHGGVPHCGMRNVVGQVSPPDPPWPYGRRTVSSCRNVTGVPEISRSVPRIWIAERALCGRRNRRYAILGCIELKMFGYKGKSAVLVPYCTPMAASFPCE